MAIEDTVARETKNCTLVTSAKMTRKAENFENVDMAKMAKNAGAAKKCQCCLKGQNSHNGLIGKNGQ